MDALEFLKERKRMCNSYKGCGGCPLIESHCVISHVTSDEDYEKIIATVEHWSKEHPRKTRQSVLLEQYPEAELDLTGVIAICPTSLSSDYRGNGGGCKHPDTACYTCRRQFWMQEVE